MPSHMGNLIEALKIVLSTELLAKSDSELAKRLGYNGRTPIKRIKDDEAGWKCIANFCARLNDELFVSEETLFRMASIVLSTSEFCQLIKGHCDHKDPDFSFKVLLAFISHDFSFFDQEFRDTTLNDILQIERSDPEALYIVLSYFYIKSTHLVFYKGKASHQERCASLLEPLGHRFIELYPENGLAAASVYAYSISKIYSSESQTLWSLLTSMANMLRFFAHPVDTLRTEPDIRRLSGISDRSYWQGKNPDEVILTWYMSGSRATNGHYEVIKIHRDSGHMEDTASLTFLSDEILSVFSKPDSNSELGVYSWDGNSITFSWEKEDADPTRAGNSWTLLKLDNSQSLRILNRRLDDESIMQEVMRSEGFESDCRLQIADVVISREKYTLEMKTGQRYTLYVSEFPFLRSITPSELVLICHHIKEDTYYAIWPSIKHSIPLYLFTKE